MSGSKVSRDHIVSAILSIRLEQGLTLKQVQVSQEVYNMANKFVILAPNFLNGSEPYRFKVLYRMESNVSIYDLLMADAADTAIENAETKVSEWQEASKGLLRYALNLLLAPKRPEFQTLKLSTPFYVYQIAKRFKEAEKILVSMGYRRVSKVQELKYQEDTSNNHIAEIAADLVILDRELSRVKGLISGVRKEKSAISLRQLLHARSHPSETLTDAMARAHCIFKNSTFPSALVPVTCPDQPASQKQPEGCLREPNQDCRPEQRRMLSEYSQSQINDASVQQRAAPKVIPRDNISRDNHPVLQSSEPAVGKHYHNLPLDPERENFMRQANRGLEQERKNSSTGNNISRDNYPVLQSSEPAVGKHYHNLPLDPDAERENLMKQANRGLEQERKNSSTGNNVNFRRTDSNSSEESPYVNVNFSNGVLQVGAAKESLPPNPLDLPEPIVQDAAELDQLQRASTDDGFNSISHITDARSDHISLGSTDCESLTSLQPRDYDEFNKDVEDAWPSNHSNRSNGSQQSHPHTSGSEDIYGSESNSIPSLGGKQSEVFRQDASVLNTKAPVKDYPQPHGHDSDYKDSETVCRTTPAAQIDYYNQDEQNEPIRKNFKHLEKYPHSKSESEHVLAMANKVETVNQETSNYQMGSISQNEPNRTSEIDLSVQMHPVTRKPSSNHTYIDDSVHGKDCRNEVETRPRLSGDIGNRIPVPTPRSSPKPKIVPRQKKKSSDPIVKCHSSPVSSTLNSLETGEQLPKFHTSPLSSLDTKAGEQLSNRHTGRLPSVDTQAGEQLPKLHTSPFPSMDTQHFCVPDKPRLVDKGADSNFSSFDLVELTTTDDPLNKQVRVSSVPDSDFPSFDDVRINPQGKETRATFSTATDSSNTTNDSCPSSLVNESHRPRAGCMISNTSRKKSSDFISTCEPTSEPKISPVGGPEETYSTDLSNLDTHPERRRGSQQVGDTAKMGSKEMTQPSVINSLTLRPVAVSGTWTCSYCFNIVHDDAAPCDVCGRRNECLANSNN